MPIKQGLYDPLNERDSCGMGFVAHVKGERSHAIIVQGLQILESLVHRGGVSAWGNAGAHVPALVAQP